MRDCALLYRIIAGRDPCDSTTADVPEVAIPEAEDLKGLRVGVPREMIDAEGIEPGVREAVERAIELARELGAEVGECELPKLGRLRAAVLLPDRAGGGVVEPRPLRRRALRRCASGDGDYHAMVERTRDEGFGDEPKRRIMLGAYALSAGYYEAYYGQAQKVRTVILREHEAAFERFDVLVSPTSPTVAFELGAKTQDPLAMYASDLLTIPSCMAGLPGLNIPCGLSEGLPVGLQLIGPQFAENTLFARRARARARARVRLRPGAAPMTDWEPVIGLEIHVHLKTRTKMFCACEVALRASGRTRTPARSASRTPARCRCRTGWRSSGR